MKKLILGALLLVPSIFAGLDDIDDYSPLTDLDFDQIAREIHKYAPATDIPMPNQLHYYTIGLVYYISDHEIQEIRDLCDRIDGDIVFENLYEYVEEGAQKNRKAIVVQSNKPYQYIKNEFFKLSYVKFTADCQKLFKK